MFHRFVARLTLACYGIIAVFGQGLHLWMEECEAGHAAPQATVSFAEPGKGLTVVERPAGCEHDSDDCCVCQHHSLGQLFVAVPPVDIPLAVCDFLSHPAIESAHCPALYSPARPRAPPVV